MATVTCRQCGQESPPEARFCGNCGSSLAAGVEAPSAPSEVIPPRAVAQAAVVRGKGLAVLAYVSVLAMPLLATFSFFVPFLGVGFGGLWSAAPFIAQGWLVALFAQSRGDDFLHRHSRTAMIMAIPQIIAGIMLLIGWGGLIFLAIFHLWLVAWVGLIRAARGLSPPRLFRIWAVVLTIPAVIALLLLLAFILAGVMRID